MPLVMGCSHLHSSEMDLEITSAAWPSWSTEASENVLWPVSMLRSDAGLVPPKHLHLALRDPLALLLHSTKHVGSELPGKTPCGTSLSGHWGAEAGLNSPQRAC